MNSEQLDIKEISRGVYELEFPYNEDYIDFLKGKVPSAHRAWDPDSKKWTVKGEKYVGHLESIGLQRFKFVMFIRHGKEGVVYRNCRTGAETVQKTLF